MVAYARDAESFRDFSKSETEPLHLDSYWIIEDPKAENCAIGDCGVLFIFTTKKKAQAIIERSENLKGYRPAFYRWEDLVESFGLSCGAAIVDFSGADVYDLVFLVY